jgi:hypothetical protein
MMKRNRPGTIQDAQEEGFLRLSRGERRAGAMLTDGMVLTARPVDL